MFTGKIFKAVLVGLIILSSSALGLAADSSKDGLAGQGLGVTATALSSPVYALWNGFLNMTNVLELVNTGSSFLVATVTLYDINGNPGTVQEIGIDGHGQYDLILNGLPTFSSNSYGIVGIEYSGQDLSGRVSFYRSAANALAGDDYEFAFAVPLIDSLSGESYVGFNTFQPSFAPVDANNQVTNWLSIVNLDAGGGGKVFTVSRYGINGGAALRSEQVVVPAFGRVDIDGGHGEGPSVVGYNKISPTDPSAPYIAQLVRYGADAPAGQPVPSYSFAFPLLAKPGGPAEQWVPISGGAGAENWLEIVNVSDQSIDVSLSLYNNLGNDVTPAGQGVFSLAAHAQTHINASSQLNGFSGAARISAATSGVLVGQSMFYFYNPFDLSIQAMYSLQFGVGGSGTFSGSWNLYLGMFNWLRVFNTGNSQTGITLTVYNSGQTTYALRSLGAKQGIDIDLHQTLTYGTSPNNYGLFRVEGSNIKTELLRLKPTLSGGIDFAAPTMVIPTTVLDDPNDPQEICARPVNLVNTSSANYVVGNGTPESCNELALAQAIAGGGIITFNCGSNPHTITLTSEKMITSDTVLDGGNLITLSGGGTTRILNMDTGNFEATSPRLTVQRLSFINGKATGTLGRLGYELDGGGGAIYYRGGSVTAIDCIFFANRAAEVGPDVGGGAIYGIGVGTTTVVGCRMEGNRGSNGGAIGALHTGLTVVNSSLIDNTATGFGANYQDEQNQQQGSGGNGGALVMDGNGRTLHICGTLIQGSSAGALGGALFRTGYESEPTIIDRSTINANSVRDNSNPDVPSAGGALYIQGTNVSLTASTISNNAARSYAGVWVLGHGPNAPGVANLTNVTIAGNYTYPRDPFTTRGIGAGLIIGSNTTGTVLNCSILNNRAQFGSGIINVSPLVVSNSLIANQADNEWTPLNCTGSSYNTPPGSGQYNIQWPNGRQSDMDCVPGILRSDPLIGQLNDNGGPTKTMAPLLGSAALRAGSNCAASDQRGTVRSEPCTIGAYEGT